MICQILPTRGSPMPRGADVTDPGVGLGRSLWAAAVGGTVVPANLGAARSIAAPLINAPSPQGQRPTTGPVVHLHRLGHIVRKLNEEISDRRTSPSHFGPDRG